MIFIFRERRFPLIQLTPAMIPRRDSIHNSLTDANGAQTIILCFLRAKLEVGNFFIGGFFYFDVSLGLLAAAVLLV